MVPDSEYQRDLAILQRLKETIKNGQHPYYRPIPLPQKLAQLYQGPYRPLSEAQASVSASRQTTVQPHPEQIPEASSSEHSRDSTGSSAFPIVLDFDGSRQTSLEPDPPQSMAASMASIPDNTEMKQDMYKSDINMAPPTLPHAKTADITPSTTPTPSTTSALDSHIQNVTSESSAAVSSSKPEPAPNNTAPNVTAPSAPVSEPKHTQPTTGSISDTNPGNGKQVSADVVEPARSSMIVPGSTKDVIVKDLSKKGVYDHRVIYERQDSAAEKSRRKAGSNPSQQSRHGDFHARAVSNVRERRLSSARSEATSIIASNPGRSDSPELLVMGDPRRLPQDRLFPPDDPRAPIDRTSKPPSPVKAEPSIPSTTDESSAKTSVSPIPASNNKEISRHPIVSAARASTAGAQGARSRQVSLNSSTASTTSSAPALLARLSGPDLPHTSTRPKIEPNDNHPLPPDPALSARTRSAKNSHGRDFIPIRDRTPNPAHRHEQDVRWPPSPPMSQHSVRQATPPPGVYRPERADFDRRGRNHTYPGHYPDNSSAQVGGYWDGRVPRDDYGTHARRQPTLPLADRLTSPRIHAQDEYYHYPQDSRVRRRSPSPGYYEAPPGKRARNYAYNAAEPYYDLREADRMEEERRRVYDRQYGHSYDERAPPDESGWYPSHQW